MVPDSTNGKAGSPALTLGDTPAAAGGDGASQTATAEDAGRAANNSAEPPHLTKPRNHGKWVWMKRDHLKSLAQLGRGRAEACLVYMVLRNHDRTAGDQPVFVTTDTLMNETGLARNAVLKSISKLETAGLLEVTRATAKCNRYKFPSTVRPAHHSDDTNGAPGALHGAPGAPLRCARRTVNSAPGALEREEGERREEKGTDLLAPKPSRAHDELFDAVAELGGADSSKDGKRIGRVCKMLRQAEPPYTAEDVRALPAAIAATGMSFTLTVEAIGKHIGFVRRPPTTVAKPARKTAAEAAAKAPTVVEAKIPTPEEVEQRRREAADYRRAQQEREQADIEGARKAWAESKEKRKAQGYSR
jgi:hypothetical protein